MAYLAPSILSADLLRLREEIQQVAENGADFIHVDVMDGCFVPNLTFGAAMVRAVKNVSTLTADVHLMIVHPEKYIKNFARAGAGYITVHQEACLHLDRVVQQIKDENVRAGVALNPATPIGSLIPILSVVDLVLIMSVNPGFGGQKFIPYSLSKIAELAALRKEGNMDFLIEVDGGINTQTAPAAVNAGADVLVAGNAVFKQNSIAAACRALKAVVADSGGEI